MNNFTFAIGNSCNIPPIKTIARQVKTKGWVKRYSTRLGQHIDRLTTAGCDNRRAIRSMLEDAYGVNIGGQVLDQLDESQLTTIRQNILESLA